MNKLGPPFAATVAWLASQRPDLTFVAPMANAAARAGFERALGEHAPGAHVHLEVWDNGHVVNPARFLALNGGNRRG